MSELLGTYALRDRRRGQEVVATLWRSLEERHVQNFVRRWKSVFDAPV